MVSARQWLDKMASKAAANGRFLDSGSGHLHFNPLRISSSDGGWKVPGTLVRHRPGLVLACEPLPSHCRVGTCTSSHSGTPAPGQRGGCSEVHLGQARATAQGRRQPPGGHLLSLDLITLHHLLLSQQP